MHKKIVLIIIMICVLFACIGYYVVVFGNILNNSSKLKMLTAKDQLQLQDFKIGGLYLQQPISEVVKILGKPLKVETKTINGAILQNYYFSGVIVGVYKSDQKVFQLRIENKNLITFRGIKVGDKEEKVYYHYGKGDKMDNEIVYWMHVSDTPNVYYAIGFNIKNSKVERINYDYAPEE
ncbi:MAG: hypothetical protein K6U80_20340 [Firmicutes bacterium]|nr:hypothetical protein [Bacillota bacterium]